MAFTWDGNITGDKLIKCYINGELKPNQSSFSGPITYAQSLLIGSNEGIPDEEHLNVFSGFIKYVRVWNVVRTLDEIKENIFLDCTHENIIFNVPLIRSNIIEVIKETSLENENVEWRKAKMNMVMAYPELEILSSFEEYIDNEKLSDITFHAENIAIFAHKLIIVCRSPYWKSMLVESNMHEISMRDFVIKDFKYSSFKKLIYYMYTGKLQDGGETDMDENFELLTMADMYLMPRLKSLIEWRMIPFINEENFKNFEELTDKLDVPIITSIIRSTDFYNKTN